MVRICLAIAVVAIAVQRASSGRRGAALEILAALGDDPRKHATKGIWRPAVERAMMWKGR